MVYGLWQSADGLAAQDYRQTILANNLANADTPGFKAERVAFSERLNASLARGGVSTRNPTLDPMTGGVFETPTYVDFSPNQLIPSDSRFDVGIDGDGFLRVQTSEGAQVTRDGRMIISRDGTLRHAATGGAVLDVGGRPITLHLTALDKVKIDSTGRIRQGETVAGQIALVDFADRQALVKTGKNLFSAAGARQTVAKGEIRQFLQESSGVEPISAMTDLIAASRAYQLNASMISLQDESLGRTVNELGRIA